MSENGEVDKISQLPDDALVAIISRLTWREAIATSILSTRWRHLYTYITRLSYSTLHPSERSKDKYFQQLQEKEFSKHMNETYDFFASNKDPLFLEEFKLHIPCLKGGNIKRLLPLVLEKEVESIDIRIIYHNKAMPGYYTFPRKTLINRKGGDLGLFPGLKSLRKLSLRSLHVDDRDVELFVSNCAVLEHLSIVGSYRYSHPEYSIFLQNVPKLVEFNASDQRHVLGHILPGIASPVLDQLLHINVVSTEISNHCILPPLPVLNNLKHLKLQVNCMDGSRAFLHDFPRYWRCPSLQKLEIKLLWMSFEVYDDGYHALLKDLHETGMSTIKPRSHLKEVTLSGCIGSPVDLSLLFIIIKQAVALETLIVEPCQQTPEIRQRAAALAREYLKQITPVSTNLIIM
ncbi:putative F-box/FBD/LRR-repeat protein At3g49040 isoform X2 [Henckelia pumila]|uniref:putative F-box/FBD/LRR-repeat protein At3g49040 isoform X2 n=1 Tax=Henckelia pumila TaxID=405737 RepID=UPI003C6E22AD